MTITSGAGKEKGAKPWLEVGSLSELLKHEKEIVDRIERMPNGGQLFLIHPFLLLRDIGVVLSEKAEAEIRRREPRLSGLSPTPYAALKACKEKQNVRFHVRGLFNHGRKS
jgi:hypothetical protein